MAALKTTLAAVAAFAGTTAAHGFVSGFVTDGTWNQGFLLDYYYLLVNTGSMPDIASWYAENLDSGFVSPDMYQTSDINCHINSEPGVLTSSVEAGGTVEFQWTEWPHGIGPVLTYVAACGGDCADADKTALEWVKIDEAGIDYDTQVWAAQDLIDNNNTWATAVPSSLASGNYVFRHEIIALHGGGSENGAQNYPQCINIEITGSGTDSPSGTLGIELYGADDPGILFNPYVTVTDYVIPGPALYAPSSGSGSDSGSDDSTTTTTTTTTSSAATTSATSEAAETTTTAAPTTASATSTTTTTSSSAAANTTTTASSGDTVALYGQCGGIGHAGSTTCAEAWRDEEVSEQGRQDDDDDDDDEEEEEEEEGGEEECHETGGLLG
ncbi:hypothetical protein MKZ38_010614 [Zalerion maritima]|uniref:lytic cellulose monooxygenase (C4-dehydrogenating) n=1 Tax=Zalerion maritima TaxID=339359 RepID=A0AAD5RSA1_9PEZI|nr:hypothetical protein MKZ38_010614 [Zalerion maritima]